MSRTRNQAPAYIPHKKSGRGRLQWYDHLGIRHEKLLPGPFGSPESLAAKARLELELATSPTATVTTKQSISVAEVLVAFLDHAQRYYVDPSGKQTNEVGNIKDAIKPVRELYAELPAAEFGPKWRSRPCVST